MARLPKKGRCIVCWNKFEKDILFKWGKDSGKIGRLFYRFLNLKPYDVLEGSFGKNLYEELEERGWDLTTLRITIDKKKELEKSE